MKPSDVLPQQGREHPEPVEQANPVPWPVLALVALMMSIGIVYIANADINTPARWGDGRQASELSGPKKAAGGGARIDGAALFASLCAACHQASGQGLPGVFPPLAGSEWAQGKDSTVSAIVLYGITGSVHVKGQLYNGAMPTFKDQLSDAQIAAVLTHVRSQWGNSAPAVSEQTVAQAREQHKARTGPFGGEKELPPHD